MGLRDVSTSLDDWLGRCRTRQEGSLYERNRSFPRSSDCVVHDPAVPSEPQEHTAGRGVWIPKDVPALRIDYIQFETQLHGVWQGVCSSGVLDFKEMNRLGCRTSHPRRYLMKNIRFVVKVNRGARAPEYVQRVEPSPIQMTTNRKLALLMGKYTAEDAIKLLQNSHRIPELESVQVNA